MVNDPASVPSTPGAPMSLPAAIAAIADPEVPVLSIEDLGILRDVQVNERARTVTVLITPTYSGCPAMDAIRAHIEHVARRMGYAARVRTRLSPAWTTDWMSPAGRDKLAKFGIAPPGQRSEVTSQSAQPISLSLVSLRARRVTCPLCGSDDTEEISRFGSTACKALRCCNACREPFDEFKTI